MTAINDERFCVDGFSYDPASGWIYRNGRRRDYNDSPYRRVSRKRIRVMAQRLAWRLHYGVWPPRDIEIDHHNCNVQDNRIGNLRLATHSQNSAHRTAHKQCRSGERGVYWTSSRKKWAVAFNCKHYRVWGYASHKLSAILAARMIRRVLHGEFAATQEAA